jgi:hypothetical protein
MDDKKPNGRIRDTRCTFFQALLAYQHHLGGFPGMNDRQNTHFVSFSHFSYTFINEGGIRALHLVPAFGAWCPLHHFIRHYLQLAWTQRLGADCNGFNNGCGRKPGYGVTTVPTGPCLLCYKFGVLCVPLARRN